MIKGVIFDLDGVIVSTDNLHYQAWKELADKEGIYFDEEINNKLRGISRMDSLDIIIERTTKDYSIEDKKEMAKYKNNIYIDLLDSITPNYILKGIVELIDLLKNKNFKIAIGASSRNAKKILNQLKMDNLFDAVSDGTDVNRSKPFPDVFLVASDKLGIEPKYLAVVEDAISGIEAAKAANMMAFAVGDAMNSPLKDYDFKDIYKVLNLND